MNFPSDVASTGVPLPAVSSPASLPVADARAVPQSLREYQRQLAERTRSAQHARAPASRQLGFIAGTCGWLIDLGDAAEIMPVPAITRVPGTQPWFAGLLNHRGRLIGVVDFAVFLGQEFSSSKISDRLIVLSDRFPMQCALRVNAVSGLMDVSGDADSQAAASDDLSHQRPQWQGPLLYRQGKAWRRLALHALIADPRFADAAVR